MASARLEPHLTSKGDVITAGYNAGYAQGGLLTVGFGSSWDLQLEAPLGQQLAVGTYSGAIRAGFVTGSAPGLALFGKGRGCNAVTGSFTIYQLALGANGSVDSLNATFQQVCDNGPGQSQGRVLINVAGPPAATITASVAANGLVTTSRLGGQLVTVWGTVTCNVGEHVTITGTLQQLSRPVTPQLSGTASCAPGSAFPWTASGVAPFPPTPGNAAVVVSVSALDPYYLIPTTTTVSASVQLSEPTPPPPCVISRCARVSMR